MRPKAYSYVRMSSDEQVKGDSSRRQLSTTAKYALEHNLELAEPILDLGVSSFRGDNKDFGKLRAFLDLIERGMIDEGSYLIVESLDRLSRQNVSDALGLFQKIVQAGINIVTLLDRQVYRKESFGSDPTQVIVALITMIRAHEESRTKSDRIAAAWKNKRDQAAHKKLTKICPAWLHLSNDRKSLLVNEDRAEMVREIFRLTRDGYGAYSIARRFNSEGRPTWSNRASLWHESYIKKILENRAVLGEYQPHRMAFEADGKGRRTAEGIDPIPDYYPKVVDLNLFLEAQDATKSRRVAGSGRKGKSCSNLFSGLLKCGACGRTMRYVDKGPGPKGGQYLKCASALLKGGCTSAPWRYQVFQKAFLESLREVDLAYVLGGQRQDELLVELNRQARELESQNDTDQAAIDRVFAMVVESALGTHLVGRTVDGLALEIEKRKAGLARVREQIADIHHRQTAMPVDEIAMLMDRITNNGSSDFDDGPRRLLAGEIRRVVKSIELHSGPVGHAWELEEEGLAFGNTTASGWRAQMLHSEYIVHYASGKSQWGRPMVGEVVEFGRRHLEWIEQRKAGAQASHAGD